MNDFKQFYKKRKSIFWIFIFCVLVVLLTDIFFIQPFDNHFVSALIKIIRGLSFAFITSILFYYFNVWKKEQADKRRLNPIIANKIEGIINSSRFFNIFLQMLHFKGEMLSLVLSESQLVDFLIKTKPENAKLTYSILPDIKLYNYIKTVVPQQKAEKFYLKLKRKLKEKYFNEVLKENKQQVLNKIDFIYRLPNIDTKMLIILSSIIDKYESLNDDLFNAHKDSKNLVFLFYSLEKIEKEINKLENYYNEHFIEYGKIDRVVANFSNIKNLS